MNDMTLLDYFAAQVMPTVFHEHYGEMKSWDELCTETARLSYDIAKAMLIESKERNQSQEPSQIEIVRADSETYWTP